MKELRFIIAVLLSSCAALAHAFVSEGLHYKIIDDIEKLVEVTYEYKNDTLNYYNRSHIDIPGYVQHNMQTYEVAAIGDSAFMMARSLKTVTFPLSITRIGKQAFLYSGLTEFKLPKYVETLCEGAFEGCFDLKSCELNTTIDELPSRVFGRAYSLRYISLPPQIKVIGDGAFYDSAIESIKLPKELEQIKDQAFAETFLRTIRIPDKVHTIGYQAFYYSNLDSVFFGKSLRNIGPWAFTECYSLKYINELPQGLERIGELAFASTHLDSYDLVVPGSTQVIGEMAFADSKLRSVVFEKGVKKIEGEAFFYCNLTEVNIPEGMSYIGSNAFGSNAQLTAFNVDPANQHFSAFDNMLTSKQQDTLYLCPTAKEGIIRFPETMRVITENAFNGCSKITTVILNEGFTDIGNSAFYECEQLDSIYVPQSIESWGRYALYGTKWEKEHERGLQYLGPVALNNGNYTKFNKIIIKDGTTCIADDAFTYCDYLSHVILPKGLKYIGSRSFANNRVLSSIRIPESVKRIGYGAFQSNVGLHKINFPESVNSIGAQTVHLTNLEEIYYYGKKEHWFWIDGGWNYCTFHVTQDCYDMYERGYIGGENKQGYPRYIEAMGPFGDLNNDFHLDVGDVNYIINMMLGKSEDDIFLSDFDGDRVVDVSDLNDLINLLMNK